MLEGGDAATEGSAHLAGGLAGLGEGLGFDEVADGFCLGEIELAGEEGAFGEFAGLGDAGTEGEGAAKEEIEDDGGAVGCDLNQVVASVGVGSAEEGDYGFVDLLVAFFVEDGSEAGAGVFEGLA